MCDTLCALGSGRMFFAKSSDRPPNEVQVLEAYARRGGGGQLRTQYLAIEDAEASALVGSRPTWLWGFEHGVNEHRVAIGNERIWTVDPPGEAPAALIGMDLVRLGLERARDAEHAVDVVTGLLERHGQGGVADAVHGEAYFSSFLIADPGDAWVLETSARTWAARRVEGATSISNRISIRHDWSRASADVPPGSDFDAWRDPQAWTAHADRRLEVTRPAAAATGSAGDAARTLAATLRSHGNGSWGAPGADADDVRPLPPPQIGADGAGVTVCMHIRGYQATTASLIAELPEDRGEPLRAWAAPGSPCVSVFVPLFPPAAVPVELGMERTWRRFAALRERADAGPEALARIRRVLAPVEAELWEQADRAAGDRQREAAFAARAWRPVEAALRALEDEAPALERAQGAGAGRP